VNLAAILIETARRRPRAEALRRGGRRVGYAELDRASARVADRLVDEGIGHGDRVGLMVPNVPEFVAAYYGILRAGGVVVPLDVDLKRGELRSALADAGPSLLIAWRGLQPARAADAAATWLVAPGAFFDDGAPAAEPGATAERRPGDTAVILYTSGTGGEPKGAELTHANLLENARATRELFSFCSADAVLAALPLTHAFGQTCTLNAAVLAGARLVLVPQFDARAVRGILTADGVTVQVGVPSMYAALLAHGGDAPVRAPALRLCISGGAPLAPELHGAVEAAFGAPLLEGYGLTETSPVASFNRPGDPARPGSIGTPIDGVEMRLLDVSPDGVGEIAVRGHNVMKGYWNRPDDTRRVLAQDGWLRTGDLARVDVDGAFWIVGRAKDLIIRDGRNVHPREIEDVVQGHPDVLEAAVLGVPDRLLGEEVVACVVVAPEASVTADDLRDYVRDRVADSKYPRRVWIASSLPHGPTGKLLKRAIVVPGEVAAPREIAA
jgi:long-chain acyl-CoA synthetase